MFLNVLVKKSICGLKISGEISAINLRCYLMILAFSFIEAGCLLIHSKRFLPVSYRNISSDIGVGKKWALRRAKESNINYNYALNLVDSSSF